MLLLHLFLLSANATAAPAANATAAPAANATAAEPPKKKKKKKKKITPEEADCIEEAKEHCHEVHTPKCPAVSTADCCNKWYKYLEFCYAFPYSWCEGPSVESVR